MMKINFIYAPDVSLEQMIGYEIASIIWGQLFTDDIEVNILAKCTDTLDSNVIGGAIPNFHEQHYALFLQYYEADITSEEDQIAFDALQQGNTIDFLLDGDLVGGNTKLKLTTALAKALGMTEAISLERYVLDESENFFDGTIMMNREFTWDFNYLRNSEAPENTLDFMSVALHETGHILGFTSSLDFSLQEETLYSGRTELSNFSPLDLFRFSAESLAQDNPDGAVNDLSIGGVAWFSTDGGETLTAKMSTGKEGDGYQASHWERRYDPLGIMDPTLWYQERVSITDLDVLAFDLMGYDLSSGAKDVEQLFESQNLEAILAQAKVQLANKLGFSVQYLEDNADVPVSSLELIGEMETAYAEAAAAEASTTETTNTEDSASDDSGSSPDLESADEDELKDFFKDLNRMMGEAYRWWSKNNGEHGGPGENRSSSQEFYEWWWQNNGGGNAAWQELYEWWWQNNGQGNGSWQELYEWWWQNNGGGNAAWQELYEWWWQDNSGGNSWWQEAFYASQDEGNLEDVELPGESNEVTNGPTYYQEFHGGQDDDVIGGDISDDNIIAGAGDDLIDGAEGNDTIVGGDGFDTIFGFDGHDSIMGGVGDDVISGESDNDVLLGEAGADVLMGGDHDDYLDGGTGRDFLSGDTGHDVLIGGSGDDALEGEAGKDLLVGGAGEDIGNGGSGDDLIFGDEYSESLQQSFGNNLNNLTSLFTPADASETTTDSSTAESNNDQNTNNENTNNLVLDPVRIEAENLNWSGDEKVDNKNFASGGGYVFNDSKDSTITTSTTFTGESGVYNVVLGYYDSKKGEAQVTVNLDGAQLDSWSLNLDLHDNPDTKTFVTRTLAYGVTIEQGDVLEIEGIRYNNDDKVFLDFIEFVPYNPAATIQIEAEYFNATGDYKLEEEDFASTGRLIKTDSNATLATATEFRGQSGLYNVMVVYHDVKGTGQISASLGGTEIDSWSLTKDLGGDNPEIGNRTFRMISDVSINTGDTFSLTAIKEDKDKGYIDSVEFIPIIPDPVTSDPSPSDVDLPPEPTSVTPELELVLHSDILRGGAGNDGIDGGEGNDIIFGEDELNDSSNLNAPGLNGAFHYGHSTYILSAAGTWEQVQAEAESYGGNLVTINDAAEEAWLKQTFGTTEEFWIGLTDKDAEGTFEWISDEAVTYTNWVPNEPNNSGTNADYVRMNFDNSDSGWGDLPEDSQLRGIIEVDWSTVGGNDTIFGGAGDDQVYGNSGNDVIFGDNGVTIPKTPGTLSFQQGMNGYTSTVDTFLHGGNPNTAYNSSTSLDVEGSTSTHSLLRFDQIFGSQPGQIDLDDTINSAYLEINFSDPGDSLQVHEILQSWTDTATWNSLGNGIQADGTEAKSTPVGTTGSYTTKGILTIDVTASLQTWQAAPNTNHGWAFLQTDNGGVTFDSAEGSIAPRLVVDVNQSSTPIPQGAIIHNGSAYLLTQAGSWTEAQAEATSLGGNLVTINDAAEEQWLLDTFGGQGNQMWIGLTDRIQEGQYQWESGEAFDYSNWNTGSLNGDNQQDYFVLKLNHQIWNDTYEDMYYKGIIEIKLPTTASGGNDNIFGNGGHDIIRGGAGDDVINGTDGIVAGELERDTLEGGAGADKFILGDETQAFYATEGAQDYAVIQDFNASEDIVQLNGVAGDYQQTQQGNDIHLTRNGDLVVILENNNTLNLSSTAFEYVSTV